MVEGEPPGDIETLTKAFNEILAGLKEREPLKDAFRKYMPEEVAYYLLQGEEVRLGGKIRDVSILIARWPAFYSMAEGRSPQDIADLLNAYFAKVVPPILNNHGGVDQYVGPTVMARFGALMPRPKHRIEAVAAALEIGQVMKDARLSFTLTVNKWSGSCR